MDFSFVGRINPFRPGALVSPGMFAGRGQELLALERVLNQTKGGNPSHFLVTGERGIGKSSLLMFIGMLASGNFTCFGSAPTKFLVVDLELEKEFTQADILIRIGSELNRKVSRTFKVSDFAKSAWKFLSRWEVLGVKYSEGSSSEMKPFELLDELCSMIENTSAKLRDEGFDGILILIDEADKPTAKAHLGQIAKNVTEKLARRQVHNVAIGLAGLPEVVAKLRESHESSPRIFVPIVLDPLPVEDRKQVIQKGLAEAEQKNKKKVTIDADAEQLISELSEGYPNFIQQFSFCAFEVDRDDNINLQDVKSGAYEPGGAIAQLGTKYFEDLYFDKINSDDYRKVLRVMANGNQVYFTKAEIKRATGLKETTLNNAINILKERKIIRPKDGVKGVYRLPTRSFGVWIRSLPEDVSV